jgi:hypothetical protein
MSAESAAVNAAPVNMSTIALKRARIVGTIWAFVGILFWMLRRKQTVLPGDAPGAAA